ncbi:MAG: D-aminoacyl-tRNA deacylase [Candidatus Bathyarchaeia archaeon]
MNISEKLVENHNFKPTDRTFQGQPTLATDNVELVYINVDSIHAAFIEKHFDASAIVFASRHRSETKTPTLTVHAPGNLTPQAIEGGRPSEVAATLPQRMKTALRVLEDGKTRLTSEYQVSLEVTHHGPTEMTTPVWFVEIGSSGKNWLDDDAGRLVADAIWTCTQEPPQGRSTVGFGGGHYAPKHTKRTLEEEYAVGHIIPKYAIDGVDAQLIQQVFQKSGSECKTAILDWKGLAGNQRHRIIDLLRQIGVEDIVRA